MLSKRDSYKRRVAKLQKQLEKQRQRWIGQGLEHSRARTHYQTIVASHIAAERRGDKLLLEDRFKIQELENQVAVQWRNLAEAKDDASTAKLNYQAVTKSLEQCRAERRQARLDLDVALSTRDTWRIRCETAEKSFSHRAYQGLALWFAQTGTRLRLRRSRLGARIVNRFAVWRLNKPRVDAMREGGYIPEKLVKVALEYWEHDKARIAQEAYIKEMHYGTRNGKHYETVVMEPRPTLWRRFMILIGRA